MANELRIRQLSIGGLVEDNPLALGATTLTSSALAAVTGGVGSTQHLPIVLDPDGVDGSPEVIYVTALSNGAGSGTIVRAQEGTTARAHVSGTPWVHGQTLRDVVRHVNVRRATGTSIVLNSTSVVEVAAATNGPGTGLFDLVVPASVGDILEWSFNGLLGLEAVSTGFDIYTMVSGVKTNPYGAGLSASLSPSQGVMAWYTENVASYRPLVGSAYYTVVSGDIVSSAVTCRPYYVQAAASNRTLFSVANDPLMMWLKNLGPATA